MANSPVDTIQCGKVKIDVWVNKGEKYDTMSFSISKNYKAKDGSWKTTNSYTLQELVDVQIAITQVQLRYRVKGNNEKKQEEQPAY